MYSTIVKILFLNTMLGGFPLYVIEKLFSHLIISVAWNGSKYCIRKIGNYILDEPVEINLQNNSQINLENNNQNNNENNNENNNQINNQILNREQQLSILENSSIKFNY